VPGLGERQHVLAVLVQLGLPDLQERGSTAGHSFHFGSHPELQYVAVERDRPGDLAGRSVADVRLRLMSIEAGG